MRSSRRMVLRCASCQRPVPVRDPRSAECPKCRAAREEGRPHTPINIGAMPKSALDDWLKGGGAA